MKKNLVLLSLFGLALISLAVQYYSQARTHFPVELKPPDIAYDDESSLLYDYYNREEFIRLIPPEDRGRAVATAEVQRMIYEHQNPDNCNVKTRFMLFNGQMYNVNGLGSLLHMLTSALSQAIDDDRILVDINLGTVYFGDDCTWQCLFEPLSTCSIPPDDSGADILIYQHASHEIPKKYRYLVNLDTISLHQPTEEYAKYWWRAQGAAYFAKPSQEALQQVKLMRLNQDMHHGFKITSNTTIEPVSVPFPLQNTVSIHVRHGDKDQEMTLIPFYDYAAAADQFIARNPLHYTHSLFISSEDPLVIQQAQHLWWSNIGSETNPEDITSPDKSWVVYFSDIGRMNTGPVSQLIAFGPLNTTYTWILQLLMALECDVFVGTRGSNWNRLIDELRCVWVSKCSAPYFEVGPHRDWKGYHW